MKRLSLLAALIFTGLITTQIAQANEEAVFSPDYQQGSAYVSLYLGAKKPLNKTFDNNLLPPSAYALKSQYGPNIEVALGYRKRNWRKEMTMGYSYNAIKSIKLTVAGDDIPLATSKDNSQIFSFMANIFYDYNNNSGVIPYIGLGGGFVQVSHRIEGTDMPDVNDNDIFIMRGNDVLFAYQIIAGLACPVNAHLRTSIDYRYSGTSNGQFSIATGESSPSSSIPIKGRLASHRLTLGLIYFI